MEFDQVRAGLKDLRFDTLRTDCDNFFEAVIVKNELKKLNSRLETFFGSPVFPSKKRLSFQAEDAIQGFGGIMAGQTLYFWNEGKEAIFAMIWPWQDGQHSTIKVIHK